MMVLQIIQILSENLIAGLIGCVVIAGIFLIGYFIGYKKIMKGKKKINLCQIILYNVFVVYIIMVFDETIMSRAPYMGGFL